MGGNLRQCKQRCLGYSWPKALKEHVCILEMSVFAVNLAEHKDWKEMESANGAT